MPGLLVRLLSGLASRLPRGLVGLLWRGALLWRFGVVVPSGLTSVGLGVSGLRAVGVRGLSLALAELTALLVELATLLAELPASLARLALVGRELLAAVGSLGVARLVARFPAESEAVAASLRRLGPLRGLLALRLTALLAALRQLLALLAAL